MASAFSGVGVGYYSKELDAILTYGPAEILSDKVGLPVDKNHVGRRCMHNRKEIMAVGSMVRGEIINCVIPIVRSGKVIGFIWANETLEDIYTELAQGGMKIFFSPNTEPLLGLTGILMMVSSALLEIEELKKGKRYPALSGYLKDYFQNIKAYIELFINSLHLDLILCDRDGIVQFISKHLQDYLLGDKENFCDRKIDEVFESLGFQKGLQMLQELQKSDEPYKFATINTLSQKTLNVIMTNIKGRNGEKSGVVTIFEDMENAQKEEERLSRLESIMVTENMAVALAHEIRNPLTVLKGAVKLIPESLEEEEYLLQFSNIALSEIERIEETISSLVELTRYSKPEFIALDIHQVLHRTVQLIHTLAQEQKVKIIENYQAANSKITGDPEHLQRAFLNLFLNALQAMPQGGTLTIETHSSPENKMLYIKIKDTGQGIKEEIQDKVFDLFFTTKKRGTGLGLPLTQSIIYRHQGFIFLESTPQKGTTFTIALPHISTAVIKTQGEFYEK